MSNSEVFSSLLAENEAMIAKFAADGVPLNKRAEIEFVAELDDLQHARDFRTALWDHFDEVGKPQGFDEMLYVVCDMTKQGQPHELRMSAVAKLSADNVTQAEHAFRVVGAKFGVSDVSWEFADPRNKQKGAA